MDLRTVSFDVPPQEVFILYMQYFYINILLTVLLMTSSFYVYMMYITIPGAPLRYFNDGGGGGGGGPTEVHILYPKNTNFRICLPQNPYVSIAYPKKSHTNSKLHLCYG